MNDELKYRSDVCPGCRDIVRQLELQNEAVMKECPLDSHGDHKTAKDCYFALLWEMDHQIKHDVTLLRESERLKHESAAEYLRAEAKKIPLGEGNVTKGFSSTYNALVFAAQVLEDHIEKQTEKRKEQA